MENVSDEILSVVSEEQWPIIVIRPPAEYDNDIHDQYLKYLGSIYERRKEKYAVVIDARKCSRPNSIQRKEENAFRTKYEDHVKQFCCGTAFVIQSAVMAGVITAIFWLKQPDTKHRSFSDIDAAFEWVKKQLEE